MAGVRASEDGEDPGRGGLRACYEPFRAELWSELLAGVSLGADVDRGRTMPVDGSTERDRVSTAMTWVDLSFQGQYLRQFAVETSSQE